MYYIRRGKYKLPITDTTAVTDSQRYRTFVSACMCPFHDASFNVSDGMNLEKVGGIDVGARDDGLDNGLAIGALASPCRLERIDSLFEREAMCDEGLEVDLASSNETDGELVVTSLQTRCQDTKRSHDDRKRTQ